MRPWSVQVTPLLWAEGVANGVGVDAPAVAVGVDGVLLQGRAEGQDGEQTGPGVLPCQTEKTLRTGSVAGR
jgi:hypothetical protein